MKLNLISIYCVAALVGATATTARAADQDAGSKEIVPLIVIDDVPLIDAIRNLARQAGLNYIIDPRVPGSGFGLGKRAPQPPVRIRYTDVTAEAALNTMLKDHKLLMVTNPATSVARIAPAYRAVKPVPASQVGTNNGAVIPLLVMDDVSLTEAIKNLAGAARLNVVLDPKVKSSPVFDPQWTVSFRWEKITARQALAALLDNYDLVLVEQPGTPSARITLKTPTETRPATEPEKKP